MRLEQYVNTIITTAHKLSDLRLVVSDEWICTLLLVGFPQEYKSMIMKIETLGIAVTADIVKTKILQNVFSFMPLI